MTDAYVLLWHLQVDARACLSYRARSTRRSTPVRQRAPVLASPPSALGLPAGRQEALMSALRQHACRTVSFWPGCLRCRLGHSSAACPCTLRAAAIRSTRRTAKLQAICPLVEALGIAPDAGSLQDHPLAAFENQCAAEGYTGDRHEAALAKQ